MKLEKYTIVSDDRHLTYEFLSEGPKGNIKKVVSYKEIGDNLFNLAFGDWNEVENKVYDNARSNNNDRDKVLAAVASTVIDFIKYHPGAVIHAKGFTPSRTRLYQIGIVANLDEINSKFEIMGFIEEKWEVFKKGRNYSAFYLKTK